MYEIVIESGGFCWKAVVYDTPTGRLIYNSLPISSTVNRWGDEVYFSIPVSAEIEPEGRDLLKEGELGYWPDGNAFCIFFGPTPISAEGEIRAASAVNIFGKIEGDLKNLKKLTDGMKIEVKRA
ncbi:MAG: hypothetical protein LRZ91_00505 [Desulfotomaculum sp.]|nr:hypothetical protein [Desulfotomaculum sp.]